MIETREALANYAHKAWSGWMDYLFEKGEFKEDGSFLIEPKSAQRWKRQASTDFLDLPPEEKRSDYAEADKIFRIINSPPDQADNQK